VSARRVHAFAQGRVQGVYYRAGCAEEAARLGLRGWVRNRRDGQVELVAEGPAAAVEALLAWCRRGPPMGRVDALEVHEDAPVGLEGPFMVRPTA
jgi:acylphosphatase